MRKLGYFNRPRGQALSEMALAIPLLFLFAAGTLQFSILFLSYIQFEHAAGEAARQYAAGIVEVESVNPVLLSNLGSFRRFFDLGSLTIDARKPQPADPGSLKVLPFSNGNLATHSLYGCAKWKISIRCLPPLFFSALFPNGITFETTLRVDRYPP